MKIIVVLLLAIALIAGCRKADDETSTDKSKAHRTEENSRPASDKEQVESEVREGGLKDPGGAKDVRKETEEQQKEQQQEADQANQ